MVFSYFFFSQNTALVSEAYIFSEPQAPEAAGGFYFFKQRHPVSRPDYIVQGVGQVFADDRFPFGMFLPECLHLVHTVVYPSMLRIPKRLVIMEWGRILRPKKALGT